MFAITFFLCIAMLRSVHPYDLSLIAEYPVMDETTIDKRLRRAEEAFTDWHTRAFAERASTLKRVAAQLHAEAERYARLITLEMGKILPEARAEIEKCALSCDFYAEHGESFIAEQQHSITSPPNQISSVRFEPLGAVFAIMPWNYPFWQVFRCAAPILMAGNTLLLKHAPNVTGAALAIEAIFREAGLPEGVLQTLVVDTEHTERVIRHTAVHGVTLTGSEYAGSAVAALAGKHLKRSVLELGGSDPLIVLDDADLSKAATVAVQSRMQNAGQSCIAAKRFIVMRGCHDAFVEHLQDRISALRQGNPFEDDVNIGPMARVDVAERLEQQLRASLQAGADLVCGGEREHANFQPTLIANVPHHAAAMNEETFGPLAVVVRVDSEEEAVRLANSTRYGLGASLWTQDVEKASYLTNRLHAGSVFVNALVKSTPHLPFGGIKRSGYGRELGAYGMKEFMNVKTVHIEP